MENDKVLIQTIVSKKLKEFIKKAAESTDRSVSSYIRIKITTAAERDLGINHKDFKLDKDNV